MSFKESEQRKLEADEWYCVNEFLNKMKVPTQDKTGRDYSTVGRIVQLMKMCTPEYYAEIMLSENDLINQTIHSIINKK